MRGHDALPELLSPAPNQSGRQGAPRSLFRSTPSGGEPPRSAVTAQTRLASQLLEQGGQPPGGRVAQRPRVATAISPAAFGQGLPAVPPPVTPTRNLPARTAGNTAFSSASASASAAASVASASAASASSSRSLCPGCSQPVQGGRAHPRKLHRPVFCSAAEPPPRWAATIGVHVGCCGGCPNGPGMASGGPRNTAWHEPTCSRRPPERVRAFSVLNPTIWWFVTIVAVGSSDLPFFYGGGGRTGVCNAHA